MNIHYRYSKVFKVNCYEVVYAVLTLSGINVTVLVKFFLSLLSLFMAHQRLGKVMQNRGSGLWGRSYQPPKDFSGFQTKNTHLSTLFIEKGHTVHLQL